MPTSHPEVIRRVRLACAAVVAIQLARALLNPFVSAADNLGPDGATYLAMARANATAGWPWEPLGNYYQGALYTLAMSWVVRLCDSVPLLRFINAALFALALGLSWRLVRVTLGRTAAWIATAAIALEPLALFGKYLQYEMLLCALAFAALALIDRGIRRGRLAVVAGGGLAFGLACLTQMKTLALWVGLAPWLLAFGPRAYRRPRRALVAAVIVATAALAPPLAVWAARNHALYERFTLATTGGGAHFWLSNNPDADGRYPTKPFNQYASGETDGWKLDRLWYGRAWSWIRENPAAFVALVPEKWAALFELDHARGWIGLLLALLGAWRLGARLWRRRCGFLVMPLAVTLAVHVMFLGGGRYRFPALPAQHGLAAAGLIGIVRSRARRP